MNLPEQLIASLKNLDGFNEDAFTQVHRSGEQVTSVRLNPNKIFNIQYSIFNGRSVKVPWSSNGYYLAERPSFTLDPLFHAGAYYVQEASSMFLEEVLKQSVDLSKPLKVLDLCAAPGGKSTLIQSLISKDSLLVSNEVIKTRVGILTENMTKWGAGNVIVTNNDPKDFRRMPGYFDVIVVDAPCSGSGLFRKDPEAISEWSEKNVELCAQRQQRILADIMPSLREGGVLIYSTCSYSAKEDEEICDWIEREYPVSIIQFSIPPEWNIVGSAGGYRFYPDKVKGEGFFIAAFRKTGGKEEYTEVKGQRSKAEKDTPTVTAKEIEILKPYLVNIQDLFFTRQQEEIMVLPKDLQYELPFIRSSLYIKKAGIKPGTLIRGELVPAHELAVSNIISDAVPRYEAGRETALQYLRKQEIKIPAASKGWLLVTHEQIPLGWVKVISGRINNYYPAAWRILNK